MYLRSLAPGSRVAGRTVYEPRTTQCPQLNRLTNQMEMGSHTEYVQCGQVDFAREIVFMHAPFEKKYTDELIFALETAKAQHLKYILLLYSYMY